MTAIPTPGDLAAKLIRYHAHTGDGRYLRAARALQEDAPRKNGRPGSDDTLALRELADRLAVNPQADLHALVRPVIVDLYPDASRRVRQNAVSRVRRKLHLVNQFKSQE